MFRSARIQLTAWYLLIIMLISILFSITVYSGINNELERFGHFQEARRQHIEQEFQGFPPPNIPTFDPQLITDARNRLIFTLVFINLGILVISGAAGYFLAGRTLRPIQVMIDEQNRFITDSSHELRTPLTVLRSEIEVNMRDKNLSVVDAKKLLGSNLEEVIKLQALSDNLIRLSRHENPHGSGLFADVSLLEIVKEAVKKITPIAKKKNIVVTNNVQDVTVHAEKQSLIELFVILLDNAIKYSPENTSIAIESSRKDRIVALSIADAGIGIEKNHLPHIFDRFYRADSSRTKQTVQGYGLGLSIAKKIVDAHKGTISVKSEVGKGTTFILQLPIH